MAKRYHRRAWTSDSLVSWIHSQHMMAWTPWKNEKRVPGWDHSVQSTGTPTQMVPRRWGRSPHDDDVAAPPPDENDEALLCRMVLPAPDGCRRVLPLPNED